MGASLLALAKSIYYFLLPLTLRYPVLLFVTLWYRFLTLLPHFALESRAQDRCFDLHKQINISALQNGWALRR